MKSVLVALALWSCIMTSTRSANAATIPVYLASPAKDGGGVYLAQLDADTGKLSTPSQLADAKVSFIALHPSKRFLYGVGEDKIRAFALDPRSQKLTPLNEQSSSGRGPCHVSLDPAGRNARMAN